ncbi:aspartic peptidase domain-containing protein [Mycena rebaudengoi]|nr:aspartic peptidase domain-containing protein [Mycena rebaudengoi]
MWLLPLSLPAFIIRAAIPFESLLFLMAYSPASVAFPHQPMSPDAISSDATSSPIHLPPSREICQQLTPSDLVVADRTQIDQRFSSQKHESLKRSIPAQDVDLMLMDGVFYRIIIDVGTPAQPMTVFVDTSSAGISLATYNSSASSTFVPATGTGLPSESIAIGQFIVHSQNLMINSSRGNVIGLSIHGGSTQTSAESTFLENILVGAQAAEFAFWFKRNAQVSSAAGVMTFGGRNTLLFVGDMEFHNLVGESPQTRQIQLSAITINGKTITVPDASSLSTFDTMSDSIHGPTSEVAAIWDAILGSSGKPSGDELYHFPCNTEVNITISFGGNAWPLNPTDLSRGVAFDDTSMCLGNIIGFDGGASNWTFGTAFLVPPSVGFAQLSPMAGGPSSTPPNPGASPSSSSRKTTSTAPNPGTSTSSSPSQTFTSSPPRIKRNANIGSIGLASGYACLHRRRKTGDRDQITVFRASPTNGHRTNDPAAPSNRDGMPIMRSILKMRRGQNRAVNHASDGAHAAVDVFTKTPGRLQLMLARAVRADSGRLPSELSRNPADALPAPNVAEIYPPGIASSNGPVDPVIWNELRGLVRTEMSEFLAVRLGSLQAPPSYNSRESEEEDR